MINTHLLHTGINPSVHVLVYIPQEVLNMYVSIHTSSTFYPYCIHHSCATLSTATGFTTHLSYPFHASHIRAVHPMVEVLPNFSLKMSCFLCIRQVAQFLAFLFRFKKSKIFLTFHSL